MVLPFMPFMLGRITCTECGKDDVRVRAELKVGAPRRCVHCGKTFRVTEIRNVASRGTGRPAKAAPKKAK